MSWDVSLQAVEAAAVVVGVVFGLVQLRQLRVQREVQAGLELLRPLQSAEAAEAMMMIHDLPDGLSEAELRQKLGDNFGSVLGMLALFESLGPLVARGHLPIEMYADSYRGVTIFCWMKMRPYVEEQRRKGWSNLFEWLQWLAERMEQRTPLSGDVPAFERFSAWTSGRDYRRYSEELRAP
jgi:hypothetical protein